MSDDVNYQNNPLHGLSLKNLLIELVDYYGFELLYAYLLLNCFEQTPGAPRELNLEDAEQLQEKRVKKAAEHNRGGYGAKKSYGSKRESSPRNRDGNNFYKSDRDSSRSSEAPAKSSNPWGNTKIKSDS